MIMEHGRVGASMCVGISPAGRSCQRTDALESLLELASALQSIRPCGTDEEINIDNLVRNPFRTFCGSIKERGLYILETSYVTRLIGSRFSRRRQLWRAKGFSVVQCQYPDFYGIISRSRDVSRFTHWVVW